MIINAFDFSTVGNADYVMLPMGTFAHEAHANETFNIDLHICGFEDAPDLDYEVQITNEHGLDMRRYVEDADFINPLEWALRAALRCDSVFVTKCEAGAQSEECATFDITVVAERT